MGSHLHHPQQCLRKDHNHQLLSAAKPPAALSMYTVFKASGTSLPGAKPQQTRNKLDTELRHAACLDLAPPKDLKLFFLPRVKNKSYTDHVLPCKLDNIPGKKWTPGYPELSQRTTCQTAVAKCVWEKEKEIQCEKKCGRICVLAVTVVINGFDQSLIGKICGLYSSFQEKSKATLTHKYTHTLTAVFLIHTLHTHTHKSRLDIILS